MQRVKEVSSRAAGGLPGGVLMHIPTGNGDGSAGKSSPGLDFCLLVWNPWR